MRRALSLALSWIALVSLTASLAQAAPPSKSLATITGTVKDNKGNPLAGALVSLLREGAKHVVKEARTDDNGNFIAKVLPGRYGIRAIASGFSEVVFSSVEVKASQELVYKFNLEPVGYGKTLPERRRDRDDVKWVLRSGQHRRSIFNVDDIEDPTIIAVNQAEVAQATGRVDNDATMESAPTGPADATPDSKIKPHGVVETYVAGNAYGPSYSGVNFALAAPISENVELIFSGQTGTGDAPERAEATTRIRIGERHRVGVTASGLRFEAPVWTSRVNYHDGLRGQVSLRAVDEWIVRDGIVIVMGLDYSRFIGAGGAHAFTPRFGVHLEVIVGRSSRGSTQTTAEHRMSLIVQVEVEELLKYDGRARGRHADASK
jgi:hypothetical protein